jgi:C1A family cysteine protease
MSIKYCCNTKRSPHDSRDFKAEAIFPKVSDLNIPETLDLRVDLPKVRNQGSQGSCSAMTASCMKEWQEKKDVNVTSYMSPQFVYNLRPNYPDEGMYPRDTMNILLKSGCCRESVFTYGSTQIGDNIPEAAKQEAIKFKIQGYAQVNTIDALKTALYKNGPCYICFPVYNYGPTFWKKETGQNEEGGHAVTVVGYTKTGFIIRNSWGTDWNNGGYTEYPFSQFGMHWEIWTTIDDKSPLPDPEPAPKPKKCCF